MPVDAIFICDVPALNVKYVVAKVTVLDKVITLAPRLIVLTLELLEDKVPAVTAYPCVLNVPFVIVSVFVPMFSASAS